MKTLLQIAPQNDPLETHSLESAGGFFGSTDFAGNANNKCYKQPEVAWFVGPEGGFTEEETASMIKAGFQGISIGKWIMRVETAAVVGVALLQQ